MYIVGSNNEMSDDISRRAGLMPILSGTRCPILSLLCILTRCRWERGCCDRYIVGDNSTIMSTLVYHHRLLHTSYILINYKMMMIHMPVNIRSIVDTYMDVYVDDYLIDVGKVFNDVVCFCSCF